MKNMNADFLLDIWADIKAKRLAPVAIGLGVALVAMPALMLKGGDTPSSAPLPVAAAPASSGGAEVELAEELGENDSKLDSYRARDPFDGLVKPGEDNGPSTDGTAIAPSDAIAAAGKALSGATSPGTGGGSTPSLDLGGSTDTGGSGGGLTTPDDSPTIVKRPPQGYTYQLDVKFGKPGREKRYRGLERMSFLPSQKMPALLFMGVPEDAKSAIFFVYPGLSHAGEGRCIPDETHCNFFKLAIGRDHFFTAKDREYRIHLLGVKKVKVKETGGGGVRKTSGSRRSARNVDDATGGVEQILPTLVDGLG